MKYRMFRLLELPSLALTAGMFVLWLLSNANEYAINRVSHGASTLSLSAFAGIADLHLGYTYLGDHAPDGWYLTKTPDSEITQWSVQPDLTLDHLHGAGKSFKYNQWHLRFPFWLACSLTIIPLAANVLNIRLRTMKLRTGMERGRS